jgi:GH3 auxin-responsive promoter
MSLQSIRQRVLSAVARRIVVPAYGRRYRRYERLLHEAQRVQRDMLFRWIRRCRHTRFGRDHGFAEIGSLEEFRRRVPVARYDHFAPYINAVAGGELGALFPDDERVDRFTITTGSTGTPKLNPVTPTWLKEYRKSWDLWGGKMLFDHMSKVGGKILQVIGSWDMGRTTGGIPISMISALVARKQRRVVRPFYAIPNEITDIRDPVARYYATLRLSIVESIGLIVLMNPGNLLRLAQLGDEHRESLIRDIRDGTLSTVYEIPDAIRASLSPLIKRPNAARARALEQIVERTGRLYPKDYWSQPIIACWLGGTAGYQAKYLPEYFGDCPMRDQGLVSSEGRHTIPIEDDKPQGVLSIQTGFYEFVPVAEIDSPQPVALEGHELEVDRDYFIVMTTYSGYFRFNIGDIVRCRGFVGQAPMLEFLQKGDRCGDLEGEKVTEHQFLESAGAAAQLLGIRLGFVTAVPSRPGRELPCYQILIEQGDVPDIRLARRFLEETDRRIKATNFLYSARRREKVLGPPRLVRIPTGDWDRHVQAEIERRGTGEAHYKHPALVQDAAWLDRFQAVDRVELPGDDA